MIVCVCFAVGKKEVSQIVCFLLRERILFMASNASLPARGLPPRAPDKGSFPLDHFGECSEAKAKYVACLRENGMHADAEECRQLSAAYLQCRMDTKLMAKEDLHKLGYAGSSSSAGIRTATQSEADARKSKGFLAGLRPVKMASDEQKEGRSHSVSDQTRSK